MVVVCVVDSLVVDDFAVLLLVLLFVAEVVEVVVVEDSEVLEVDSVVFLVDVVVATLTSLISPNWITPHFPLDLTQALPFTTGRACSNSPIAATQSASKL